MNIYCWQIICHCLQFKGAFPTVYCTTRKLLHIKIGAGKQIFFAYKKLGQEKHYSRIYMYACRKRRLKGRVRGSLVATSAAARCQGPRFYNGQGSNLDRVFCCMCTAAPHLGPRHRVPEPVPSLETHLKSE